MLKLVLSSDPTVRMILVAGPDTTNLQGFSLRVTAHPTPPGIQNSKVKIFSIVIIDSHQLVPPDIQLWFDSLW
jgi:hypothetical protein